MSAPETGLSGTNVPSTNVSSTNVSSTNVSSTNVPSTNVTGTVRLRIDLKPVTEPIAVPVVRVR
ncbi:MAG: hypothetical protein AAF560_25630, partial [Acidobacteriota bacterium]